MNNVKSNKVSVLIPAYNCMATIKETLGSVLNQTYKNIEVIILNDCSTDDSHNQINELIKNNSNVILKSNESNQGYLKTFNILLSMSTGDFITFLDADDLMALDKIEKQVGFLSSNPDYGFCGTGFTRTNSKGRPYENVILPQNDSEIKSHLKSGFEVCFCGSSIMLKREVLQKVGGYKEFFIGCPAEDYDWIRRMSNFYKCYNLPECLYFYRFGVDSLTRNINYDVKAQNAAELAFFFDEQRHKNQGDDALSDLTLKQELDDLILNFKRDSLSNPEKILHKKAINHAVNGELKEAFTLIFKCFKFSKIKALKVSLLSIVIIAFPNDWLLYLKTKAKFKGINKSN